MHTYVSDPRGIRDAYVSDPTVSPIGRQNRYAACVRFNARNSDGRYVGSRDVLAVFPAGRFDPFVDPAHSRPAHEANLTALVKLVRGSGAHKRFTELEALSPRHALPRS